MHINKTAKKVSACILLCSLAFLGNLVKVQLFFNIDFLMGSFFVMLAVMFLGRSHGVIAGFIAGTCTYIAWNHAWMIPVATCEALFVSSLYYKRKGNPVIYDIAYWLFIGMPMVYFFYHHLLGIELQGTLLIMLKHSVNGIFNTLLAVLAYMAFRLRKRSDGERTEYFQLVFVVMVSLVFLPTMLVFVTSTRAYQDREKEVLESRISYVSEIARNSLASWIEDHQKKVQTLSALVGDPSSISFAEMQHYVETLKAAEPTFKKMGVLNEKSVTVAYSPLEEKGRSTLGIDFSDRPYIPIMKETKRPFIPDVVIGKLGNPAPVILMLAPIIVDGEYKGYCTGVVRSSRISGVLAGVAAGNGINITVVDGNERVIASTIPSLKVMDRLTQPYANGKSESSGILHWVPEPRPNFSPVQRLMQSMLVKSASISPDCRWKIIVEAPYLPLIEHLSQYSILRLALLNVLILFTVTISHLFSKGFVSTIMKLQDVTKSFPKRIEDTNGIIWPKSRVKELAALSDNFRDMALALAADIAKRKRVEAARARLEAQLSHAQKMEAIGTLAGGVAHDFNNILAAIIGYTDISLAKISGRDPLRYNLEQILHSGHRAADLVRQILSFSRMRTGQSRQPLKIAPAIREALQFLRATLPSTVEIRQNISDEDAAVLADPTQIHQVITNLCTNAAHATEKSGGVIEVELTVGNLDSTSMPEAVNLEPGPYVRLSISDNGHGMNEPTLLRIFDPYFTTKEQGKGTGLGLSVVHGIVNRHEGAITVHSEPGKGTVFNIYLPRFTGEPVSEAQDASPLPRGNERILFVDDEEPLVNIGRTTLESLGYQIATAANGTEALEIFRKDPDHFDLVITDYTMPKMTGADLASEVVRLRPDIAVILCTGYSERINGKNPEELGIRELLMKPVDSRAMAGAVRRALNGKA